MSEMVERVARTICAHSGACDPHPCDMGEGGSCKPGACSDWGLYIDSARAAIGVMREPTPGMVEAGRFPAEDDGPVACWRAMIDDAIFPASSDRGVR